MRNATRHAAAALAALVLSSSLAIGVAPLASAADEVPSAPPTALEVCQSERGFWQSKAAFWEAQSSSFEELLRASQADAKLAAEQWVWWQTRSVGQDVEVAEMKATVERVRERLARQRAKVESLREELADRT